MLKKSRACGSQRGRGGNFGSRGPKLANLHRECSECAPCRRSRVWGPHLPDEPRGIVAGQWGEGVTVDEMSDYIWLRPEIEAEIKFAEWTTAGLLRHAEFVTLRADSDE